MHLHFTQFLERMTYQVNRPRFAHFSTPGKEYFPMSRSNQLRENNIFLISDVLLSLAYHFVSFATSIYHFLCDFAHGFVTGGDVDYWKFVFGAMCPNGVEDGFAGGEFPDGVGLGRVGAVAGAWVQAPEAEVVVFAGGDEAGVILQPRNTLHRISMPLKSIIMGAVRRIKVEHLNILPILNGE